MQMLKKLQLILNLFNFFVYCLYFVTQTYFDNKYSTYFYISHFGDALQNCQKLRLASSCLCACPYVRPHRKPRFPQQGFS